MKGWLASHEGICALHTERFFFRLQWGFMTQHLTESSAAVSRYCIHNSRITLAKNGLKLYLVLGPLGKAYVKRMLGKSVRRLTLEADDSESFHQWVNCLFRARDRPIEQWYSFRAHIGLGSDGEVLLGVSRFNSSRMVAIKRISLMPGASENVVGMRLVRILKEIQLQHKAAVRTKYVAAIIDVFYDNDFCYIVLEHANHGSLSDLLEAQQGSLPETMVRSIAIQLGRCLLALHQCHIVHRDIKCDNVLLSQIDSSPLNVRLADFGFATVWRPDSGYSISDFCTCFLGTETYLAPEIILGERYGAPADIFSLGVLCYVCLVGEFPFEGEDTEDVFKKIVADELEKLSLNPSISANAKSFCKALLNKDPRKRLTAAALLQHRWLWDGHIVTHVQRRRPSGNESYRVVLRRVFHVISAVRAMQALAGISRQEQVQCVGRTDSISLDAQELLETVTEMVEENERESDSIESSDEFGIDMPNLLDDFEDSLHPSLLSKQLTPVWRYNPMHGESEF